MSALNERIGGPCINCGQPNSAHAFGFCPPAGRPSEELQKLMDEATAAGKVRNIHSPFNACMYRHQCRAMDGVSDDAVKVARILQSHLGASRDFSGLDEADKALWDSCQRVMDAGGSPQQGWRAWPMRGVRVDGETVVVSVKGGSDAARFLCGELVDLIEAVASGPAPG